MTTILGFAKRIANNALRRRGHVIAAEAIVPSFERLVVILDPYGLRPRHIVDIGVADGTPWLYTAFPDAEWILVDPTREALPHMERWARKLGRAQILPVALGAEEGTATIRVRDDGIGGSSLFAEIGPHRVVATYEVPVRRFDSVVGPLQRPALCKIDVQGSELAVIEGMGERVRDLDIIIVETSLIRTLEGDAPEFGDIARTMADRDFVLYDIVGVTRRPLDQALAQIDAVFVPQHSILRQDRRWRA